MKTMTMLAGAFVLTALMIAPGMAGATEHCSTTLSKATQTTSVDQQLQAAIRTSEERAGMSF